MQTEFFFYVSALFKDTQTHTQHSHSFLVFSIFLAFQFP